MQKLVTDITYLPFGGEMMCLSSILDSFNGEIVAWSMSEAGHCFCTRHASSIASPVRSYAPQRSGECLHVSGIQEAVKGKGITMSMSRKETPADNAPIESFHSTLKSETFYLEGLTHSTTAIVELTLEITSLTITQFGFSCFTENATIEITGFSQENRFLFTVQFQKMH